jgi:hypothetical protein
MNEKNQQIETTLHDIKSMMERSSRFISLSGWSGVSAGLCALAGAWYTATQIACWRRGDCEFDSLVGADGLHFQSTLIRIALITFIAALASAFVFTYIRSKKTGSALWGHTTRRLTINVCIPMIVGGVFIFRMMEMGFFALVAPACLLFYGLALVNASKYTLGEVRYLGYGQLVLGVLNLWFLGWGLYFWAAGFGLLHIVYGFMMWWKYEYKE